MDVDKIISEMQKLIGKNMPIQIKHNPLTITYEKEWQEGGTTPVTNKKGVVIDYKSNYKACSLTKDEVKKIDSYIAGLISKA